MIQKLILLLFGVFTSFAYAQISVTNSMTPVQLVEDILIGTGVTPFNIRVNGQAALANSIQVQAGYFEANNTNFSIPYGVLLTTGAASVAVGPNNNGSASNEFSSLFLGGTDPDMNAISNGSRHTGIVLEFEFVATGNMLEFKYIFGSEEYPEFAGSTYNDAFGFFLSGPGLSGPYSNNGVNLAQVPNTNLPVTINNVNDFTNSAYYRNNLNGAAWGNALQYDGTTTLLTAFANLICGETYKIKFGILNIGDSQYDSGVFLQGGSFTVSPVAFSFNSYAENTDMYEGCQLPVELLFTRSGCMDESLPLYAYLTYEGTAVNGVDYDLLPDTIYFAPGVSSVSLFVNPIEDNIVEGMETLELHILSYTITNDPVRDSATFYIHDVPSFSTGALDTTVFCIRDSVRLGAHPDGIFPPFTFEWSNGDTTQFIYVPGDSNGTYNYSVVVTDICGYTSTDTVAMVINMSLRLDSLVMTPANCNPIGTILPRTYPFGGHVQDPNYPNSYSFTFDWTYLPDTNLVLPNQLFLENLPGGWYKLELTDNVVECTVVDSILVEVVDVPSAIIEAIPGEGCSPLSVEFKNNSLSATSFAWDLGDGIWLATNNMGDRQQTYEESGYAMLVASNGDPNCNDTSYVSITIVPCGCTDIQALNYNPSAVYNDGSCIYPAPTGWAPNVVTLNGDSVHEEFYIITEHAANIELVIVNRWGNVVFEGQGDQVNPPKWDGTLKDGTKVSEGVYFYKFIVTGPMGDQVDGQGFMTIVR